MVNRAFEDLFKVQNDSIQDKTDFDIFPKELATLFKENDRKVLEMGSPLETEETIMHIGGGTLIQLRQVSTEKFFRADLWIGRRIDGHYR